MPVTTAKKGAKYRVVEADTGSIALNSSGTALDGGGHANQAQAAAQARAVNASLRRQGKLKTAGLKHEVVKHTIVRTVKDDECPGCLSVMVGGELDDGVCMGCKDYVTLSKQVVASTDPNPDEPGFEPSYHRPKHIVFARDEYGWPVHGSGSPGVGVVGLPSDLADGAHVLPGMNPMTPDYGQDYARLSEEPWWRDVFKEVDKSYCTCRSTTRTGHANECKSEPKAEVLARMTPAERDVAIDLATAALLKRAEDVDKPNPLLLFLVRHGEAGDQKEGEIDDKRALTPEGYSKTKKAFKGLARLGVSVDTTVCSPTMRGEQTAELFSKAMGDGAYRIDGALHPHDFDVKTVCEMIQKAPSGSSLAIVGHHAWLGALTSLIVNGPKTASNEHGVKYAYSGVGRLEFEKTRMPGNGQLTALFLPRTLRKLAK